jgi:hypothetical protein
MRRHLPGEVARGRRLHFELLANFSISVVSARRRASVGGGGRGWHECGPDAGSGAGLGAGCVSCEGRYHCGQTSMVWSSLSSMPCLLATQRRSRPRIAEDYARGRRQRQAAGCRCGMINLREYADTFVRQDLEEPCKRRCNVEAPTGPFDPIRLSCARLANMRCNAAIPPQVSQLRVGWR